MRNCMAVWTGWQAIYSFDNDIDTGVKPTEDVLFHRFNIKYFFHLMIACEHSNDQKMCLFYYYISYNSLPNFYLKKTDLIGFFKIKPRHPDRLKKTDLGGRTQQWEPWVWLIILKISPVTSSVPSKERNCARQLAQCYLILAHFQHSKFNAACIYTVSHRPFNAGNPSLVACLHGCGVACV